jgi:hypothetical protein
LVLDTGDDGMVDFIYEPIESFARLVRALLVRHKGPKQGGDTHDSTPRISQTLQASFLFFLYA